MAQNSYQPVKTVILPCMFYLGRKSLLLKYVIAIRHPTFYTVISPCLVQKQKYPSEYAKHKLVQV